MRARLNTLISSMQALMSDDNAPIDVLAFAEHATAATVDKRRSFELPAWWEPMRLHPKQLARWDSSSRFTLSVGGRRTLKTVLTMRKRVIWALSQATTRGRVLLAAPTLGQARDVWWVRLREAIPHQAVIYCNEARGELRLFNGIEFRIVGNENRTRAEGGIPVVGAMIDESDEIDETFWAATIRPMLMDTGGWADIIGKPIGRNFLYRMSKIADTDDQWSSHHWTTEEVLPFYLGEEEAIRELETIKAQTDPFTYETEYRASYAQRSNTAYYSYSDGNLIDIGFNRNLPAWIALDFNIAPGIGLIIQQHGLTDVVVDEVHIAYNSNTLKVCELLKQKLAGHQADLFFTGDATGGAGGTAKIDGSDWDLVRKEFPRARDRVPRGNPRERVRVNALNRALCDSNSKRSLLINRKCRHLIQDLEGVTLIPGGLDIDKNVDSKLTHMTDALGYFVCAARPNSFASGSTPL